MEKQRPLTTKQELFIAAYLGEARGNATQAARIAGYKNPEASGKENLRKPPIASRVKEHVAKYVASADDILAELADVGFADWRDFIEIIARDKSGKPVKVKMDLSSKMKALELLGKHHQLYTEKQEIDINIREHQRAVPQSTLDNLIRPSVKRMEA